MIKKFIQNIPFFFKLLILISLAGFAIRMLTAIQINNATTFVQSPPDTTDLATYMQLSRSILNGSFKGTFYYQPFYYAAFLPAVMLLFGQSVWSVITIQSLLGALTIFFAGWCAKMLHNEKSGIITALLLALSNVLIFYTPFHKIATLQTFIVTMLTFFLIKAFASEKKRLMYYIAAGIFLGIGCATRGNLYIMLFGIIPLMLWQLKIKKFFAALGMLVAMAILVQLPFIVYNSLIEKRLCGSSTASSAVLALGNNPESPPGFLEYPESYQIFMQREKERSVPMQIIDYFSAEPLAYMELTLRKVILFYDSEDIPNNVNMTLQGGPFLNNNFTGWVGWILIFCIGGILYNLKQMFKEKDFGKLILTANIIFYGLSISMFYNLARFRAPILPAMAAMAGIFAVQCVESFKNKKYKSTVIALLAGAYIATMLYPSYRNVEKYIMRAVRPDGTHINTLNNKKAVFDNGPMSLGQWTLIPVKKHFTVEKTFAGLPENAEGLLVFNPYFINALFLEINGRRLLWRADQKSGKQQRISIPCKLINNTVRITILDILGSEGSGFGADMQRNYNRSKLNDTTLDGEWLMRFYY